MKVYVVGRGAVGSFLGDRLASIGVEVAYAPRAIDAVTPYDADVAIVATPTVRSRRCARRSRFRRSASSFRLRTASVTKRNSLKRLVPITLSPLL
jgi:hypothetical protein